jgi:hypothetical protein
VLEPVVVPAEQPQVLEVRRATVFPVNDVMRLAPVRRLITLGPRAMAVARHERFPDRRRDSALRQADIENS